MINELPIHYVSKPKYFPPYHSSAKLWGNNSSNGKLPIPGVDYSRNEFIPLNPTAPITLGKSKSYPSYGWDNEYGSKSITVTPFHAAQGLITNGEYLEFISDGGYSKQAYWSDAGWKWKSYRNSKVPSFWVKQAAPTGMYHQYGLRVLFDVIEMPWSWPVSVNYHEAHAYCVWRTLKQSTNSTNSGGSTGSSSSGAEKVKLYHLMTEGEYECIYAHNKQHSSPAATNANTAGGYSSLTDKADPVHVYNGPSLLTNVRIA